MITYMAESTVLGTLVDHLYDAEDQEAAQAIAESQGWTFLGIPVDVDMFDDMPSWQLH